MAFEHSSHVGHAIRQLQGAVAATATGDTADTDITITAADGSTITTDHAIVPVVAQDTTSKDIEAVPGTVTITDDDTIQSTSDTTGLSLLFLVFPKSL